MTCQNSPERIAVRDNNFYKIRYGIIAGFFIAICLFYLIRLVNIQVSGQDYYASSTSVETVTTRTVNIRALRGEIYDRNGVALVTNKYRYDILLEAGSMPSDNADENQIILDCIKEASDKGLSDSFVLPDSAFIIDGANVTFDEEYMSTVYGKRLTKLFSDMELKDTEDPYEALDALYTRYGIEDAEGNLLYSGSDLDNVFRVRLDLEVKNFSESEPYTILSDVSMELIISLTEGDAKGIQVSTEAERVYDTDSYATHILGTTGKIQADDAEYYTEEGYELDAIVGTSGVEKAFEEYLRGTDGEMTITEDEEGNIVNEEITKEPVAGKNVYLTLDFEMQKVAEDSLKNDIAYIVKTAEESGKTRSGEDANSGGMSVIDPDTGEVLALATFPTYDMDTYSNNYQALAEDADTPLLNRALMGQYAPGSTFKPGVAAAALQEGIITANSIIVDEGVYRYYEDVGFTPACWLYNLNGSTHGNVNVTKAIQVSCNYFFYDVGRRLGIEKMNKYCKAYGLGESTGIELDEYTGVLAGPDDGLGEWNGGDTLQAAIGQSDNLFTPLQISMYISTLLNYGQRYNAHLLYQVRDFYTDEVEYESSPQVLSTIDISTENMNTVLNAMSTVMEDSGTAARLFSTYPISVGGKTGTAQVNEESSDNAIFTAYAPTDDPEIVASIVVEHGNSGTAAGYAVRDVMNYYFNVETDPYYSGDTSFLDKDYQTSTAEGTENGDETTETTDTNG